VLPLIGSSTVTVSATDFALADLVEHRDWRATSHPSDVALLVAVDVVEVQNNRVFLATIHAPRGLTCTNEEGTDVATLPHLLGTFRVMLLGTKPTASTLQRIDSVAVLVPPIAVVLNLLCGCLTH
jgi:hypothetical protein